MSSFSNSSPQNAKYSFLLESVLFFCALIISNSHFKIIFWPVTVQRVYYKLILSENKVKNNYSLKP